MKNKKLRATHAHSSHVAELSLQELAIYSLSAVTLALGVILGSTVMSDNAGIHASAPSIATLDPAAYTTTTAYLGDLTTKLGTRDLTKPFVYEKEFDGRTVYIRFDAAQYDAGHSKEEIQAKITDIAHGVIHPEMPE